MKDVLPKHGYLIDSLCTYNTPKGRFRFVYCLYTCMQILLFVASEYFVVSIK